MILIQDQYRGVCFTKQARTAPKAYRSLGARLTWDFTLTWLPARGWTKSIVAGLLKLRLWGRGWGCHLSYLLDVRGAVRCLWGWRVVVVN